MIAFETAVILMFALIVGLLGRPLAVAYAEKLKTKSKALGSDEARSLKMRVDSLENEMRELRAQLKNAQESADFVVKLIEGGDLEAIKKLPKKQT